MRGASIVAVLASILVWGACTKGPPGSGTSPSATNSSSAAIPPLPAEHAGGGPGQPPIVWVGGNLSVVEDNHLVLEESLGAMLILKRLGKGATAFYSASNARWNRLPAQASIGAGQLACVEAALDDGSLLALRVFLGADCGPAGR